MIKKNKLIKSDNKFLKANITDDVFPLTQSHIRMKSSRLWNFSTITFTNLWYLAVLACRPGLMHDLCTYDRKLKYLQGKYQNLFFFKDANQNAQNIC